MPRLMPVVVIAVSFGLLVSSRGFAAEASKPEAAVDAFSKESKQGTRAAIKGESRSSQKLRADQKIVGPSDSRARAGSGAKDSQKMRSSQKVVGPSDSRARAGAKSSQKMQSGQKVIGPSDSKLEGSAAAKSSLK